MNLKENGILKTINFTNIVEQLNGVTKIIEGNSNGTISDIQIKTLNKSLDSLKEKLNNLETDIDKYIDETELTEALKDIRVSLENSVKTNDLNSAVNRLTTSISTLVGKIETLENREIINKDDFVKNSELDSKIETSIKSSIDKVESKFLENSKEIIKNNINTKITELVGDIDTKINDKVVEKLDLEIKSINENLKEKTKDIILQNDLTNKLKDYAKLKDNNEFVNNNDFKKVSTTELNSNIINSNTYKINNNEFISNDSMFSIGITDKDINLISKGKLMLNGVEVENNELPQTLVHTDKENTLNYKLSGTVADFNTFKIKNTEIIKKDSNNIIFGSENNITTLKGTDLYFNDDKIEFNKFIKESDLSKYAKLDGNNTFTGKIISNEVKSNSIETDNLKVNGKNVITDTSNFAKLNSSNTFTQKIKGTDIESNKSITQELILNGINVNLSNYSTNENLIKQLEKIIGLTYGGVIQDNIGKVTGKFYYDDINKYYYECISDNNLKYIDNSKFKAISNKPLNDSIGELSHFQQTRLYVHSEAIGQASSHCNIVYKLGRLVIIIFDSGNTLYNADFDNIIFSLPEGFRPKQLISIPSGIYGSTTGLIYIQPDGLAKWKAGNVVTRNIVFTVSYIV